MGLKAHLKKKIFLFTSLKFIIAETYIYIVFNINGATEVVYFV